jgi:hypothetical protein
MCLQDLVKVGDLEVRMEIQGKELSENDDDRGDEEVSLYDGHKDPAHRQLKEEDSECHVLPST